MPLPASYTEATLATYMVSRLGDLATVLGLTTASMAETVNDVALACGVTDIADASDIAQVRALAAVAALRVAQTAAAGWYDFGADGGDFKRSQVQAQIGALLAAAERDALLYGDGYAVAAGSFAQPDPYRWETDDEDCQCGLC